MPSSTPKRRRRLAGPEANFRNLLLVYKRAARKRKIFFSIPADLFKEITKQNCFLCDAPPANRYRHSRKKPQYKRPYIYNGIDRIVNSKGYVEGNVIACCWRCNCAKNDLSLADFLLHVLAVFNHRIKGAL